MNCGDVNRLIDGFRENSVDSRTETRIREHLGRCAECRATLSLADELDSRLQVAMRVAPPPLEFAARVRAAAGQVTVTAPPPITLNRPLLRPYLPLCYNLFIMSKGARSSPVE